MEALKNKKRTTLWGCFAVYIAVNAFILISAREAYSIDEFYSLGSANLSVNTTYEAAPYINALIRLLSRLFGSSYYLFKLIPLTAGFISYCGVMYLVSKLCEKKSTLWMISLAVTFNGLILFNHLYIRHYVFADMAYIVGMVFLYKYAADDKRGKIRFLYLFLFVFSNFLYYKFTDDSSATALIAITAATLVFVLLQKYWSKLFYNKFVWVCVIILLGLVEGGAILLKKQKIDYEANPVLNKIHGIISFYQVEMFTFVLFLIFAYLAVTIAAGGMIVRIFRNRFEDKKQVLLTVYTVLPMAAYFLFLFNNNLLRTYTLFMGAGYVLLACFIDKLGNNIWKKMLVAVLVINAAFTFYPFPKGIIEFWRKPMIRQEVYMRDYREWIAEAENAAAEGYTIIPLMTLISQEYFLDLDTGKSLTLLDEQNERYLTDEELVQELEELMNSGNKYVVMVDTLGRDVLMKVELFDVWKEKYRHTLYDDEWYEAGRSIFYIE